MLQRSGGLAPLGPVTQPLTSLENHPMLSQSSRELPSPNAQRSAPAIPCQLFTARDFPGGAEVKNPPANAGDTGSSPGPGRSHMPRSN